MEFQHFVFGTYFCDSHDHVYYNVSGYGYLLPVVGISMTYFCTHDG
jgi:hypothetical protein